MKTLIVKTDPTRIKRGHQEFSSRNRTHENKRKYRRNSKRNRKSLKREW